MSEQPEVSPGFPQPAQLDRGGHFAAWEQPDLFTAEMRAPFRSLR